MAAFSHYYTMKAKQGGFGAVRFTDPPRNTSDVPRPLVSISLGTSLQFTLRFLQRVGETEVAPRIEAILAESARALSERLWGVKRQVCEKPSVRTIFQVADSKGQG